MSKAVLFNGFIVLIFITLSRCSNPNALSQNTSADFKKPLTEAFKTYWFDGTAEVSSYALTQSRYGESRKGHATLIYVTEDFLSDAQVKANKKSEATVPVLKLNRSKHFLTGIYPYHIMNSTFTQLGRKDPLVKISHSTQEWCGQMYLQLNRRENLEIKMHSYFEREAYQNLNVPLTLTEDELWNRIRTAPQSLPTGRHSLLPGFEFLQLRHHPVKPVTANLSLKEQDSLMVYAIAYSETGHTLEIAFTKTSPHVIEWWNESDSRNPSLETHAVRMKTLKIPYWKLNALGDEKYRDSLNLK